MEAEKRIPSKEELIDAGISYHLDNKEIYFSVKELKKEFGFAKNHKADQKSFEVGEEKFVGVKQKNLFL